MKYITFFILYIFSILTYSQSELIELLDKKLEKDPTKTIIFIDSLLVNDANSKKGILNYYKAVSYSKNKQKKKAAHFFNKSLEYLPQNNEYYIKCLLNLSSINSNKKNQLKATEQSLIALKLSKKYNYTKLIAKSNNSLSYISYLNNDYSNSLNYLLNSVNLQKKAFDSIPLSATYNNIAIIYKNIGKLDKALEYNNLSLQISKLKKDSIGIGKTYSNIGRLYEFQGNYEKAIQYYQIAADNNLKANIINSIPYRNIGDAHFYKKNYKKSEFYYLKAIELEKKSKQIVNSNIYTSLLKTAILQNKFKEALNYQTKADSVSNINTNLENQEKLKALESQHLLFKNEQELNQEKEINNKNKIIFIIFGILAFVIGLYLFQKNRLSALKYSQEKILLEQKVLRSQMNPHFIFNALSAIQNSLLDNDPIKSASYLSRFAKLIRQNFDFINKKTITIAEEIDSLKNYMETQKIRFDNKFEYEINIHKNVDTQNTEIPPLLLQPLVENAIEHGFKNKKELGIIEILIKKQKDHICYTVKDNGKGFKNLKSDNKEHAIDILKKRVLLTNKKNNTNFKIESNETGTTIKFCLYNV